MSNVEMIILILVGCIPAFAFFVAFKPKFKNLFKRKKKDKKLEVVEENSKEEPKPVEIQPEVKEKSLRSDMEDVFQMSDFKDFSSKKKNDITFPEMKFNNNFMPTYDLDEFDRPKPKTIAEQIKGLSPELKALIVAGVLDKKDIDNI